jgi:hypothetical protein
MKSRTAPLLRIKPNLSSHFVDHVPGDEQSQSMPIARLTSQLGGAVEWLEDSLPILVWNVLTLVSH